MAIRFISFLLAILAYSASLPVVAEDLFADHVRTSYNSYISLNGGYAKAKDTCTSTYTAGASCTENGQISRIAYGYNFTRAWGLEISYGEFGKAKETGMSDTTSWPGVPGSGMIPYDWRWTAVGWEIAATGALHLGRSFSLFGKLGFLRANVGQEIRVNASTGEIWHAVMHEDSNSTSGGIGAQYDFNNDFACRIQYEYFGKLGSASKIKTSAVTAGILLKF